MYEDLIKKAKTGDKQSFVNAVMAVKDDAYKIAFCYLNNEADSMDAVSDAVEKSLVNLNKLRNPEHFKTWFMRIVINEAKMQLRKRSKIKNINHCFVDNPEETDSQVEKIDLTIQLNNLATLDRTLIYLKYYLGYTFDEIAKIVNLPVSTVKTKMYANLKLLRAKLEGRIG